MINSSQPDRMLCLSKVWHGVPKAKPMFMQRKETENIVTEFPEIFQHLNLAA